MIDIGMNFDFGEKLVEDAVVQIHGRDYRFRSSTRHENGKTYKAAFFTSFRDGSCYYARLGEHGVMEYGHQKASHLAYQRIDDIMGLRVFYDNVTGWRKK